MADPGRVAAPIQRARAKFAGAPEEQEDYTPPGPTPAPPIPTRETREPRQRRNARGINEPDPPAAPAQRQYTGEIPHWELTLADLRQQRDALDTAIAALEALYR